MKIESVAANNRRHVFEVATPRGVLSFPYSRCDPAPSAEDRLTEVVVDPELGREAFTYWLASGAEGSVHRGVAHSSAAHRGYTAPGG